MLEAPARSDAPALLAHLASSDASTIVAGLDDLNATLNEPDVTAVCAGLRDAGIVDLLVSLLAADFDDAAPAVHAGSLLAIGNLSSDDVDPEAWATKERVRGADGILAISSFLGAGDDHPSEAAPPHLGRAS